LLKIPEATVEAIIRAFCFFGRETDIHFRLRPFLPDPIDEFLLELAVAGRRMRLSRTTSVISWALRDLEFGY
jgi:hypothetical protein